MQPKLSHIICKYIATEQCMTSMNSLVENSIALIMQNQHLMVAGGMYLENATSFLPNVNQFYTDGSYTTIARDQMPSVSAPNWGALSFTLHSFTDIKCYCIIGTIITGMGPEESGIPDNSWLPPDDNPPNVTTPYLPPISGRGKVAMCILYYTCNLIYFTMACYHCIIVLL